MYFDFFGFKSPLQIATPARDSLAANRIIRFGTHPKRSETILVISIFSRSSFIWPDESLKPPFEYRNVIFALFVI